MKNSAIRVSTQLVVNQRHPHRKDGQQDAAYEIDQAGAQQVAHALHVGHDAGDSMPLLLAW